MRNAFVFVGVVVFVALFANLFVKRRETRRPPSSASSARPGFAARDQRLATLEKAAGLQKAPLRHNDTTNFIDVVVHVAPRCGPGDVDLMKLELLNSDLPDLLVSVEAVGGAGMKPLAKKTGMDLLTTGGVYTFEMPRSANVKRLGVYICKDSSKSGSCAGKPHMETNTMFMEYGKRTPRPRNPPDRIYFFQFLNIQDGEFVTAFDRALPDGKNYGHLVEYFQETDSRTSPTGITGDTRYIADLTQTAVSLPLRLGQNIQLDLPAHDERLCGSGPNNVRPDIARSLAGSRK